MCMAKDTTSVDQFLPIMQQHRQSEVSNLTATSTGPLLNIDNNVIQVSLGCADVDPHLNIDASNEELNSVDEDGHLQLSSDQSHETVSVLQVFAIGLNSQYIIFFFECLRFGLGKLKYGGDRGRPLAGGVNSDEDWQWFMVEEEDGFTDVRSKMTAAGDDNIYGHLGRTCGDVRETTKSTSYIIFTGKLLTSGMASGSERCLATLQRMCKLFTSPMVTTATTRALGPLVLLAPYHALCWLP
ncbi:hypothetical protein IFM89_002387 [Coptis chinensis]|uniref:Uncharacterized protein n=1 Tax=Coptis chinensis TaxID=261450 RepID=A0A835ILY6_9MAGN|nr:hypothetical protein IFM89_002387 [Coptis chinensis]